MHSFSSSSTYLVLAVCLASAAGCGSDASEEGTGEEPTPGKEPSACQAPAFTANMRATTPSGRVVTLISSQPAPPIEGDNEWVIGVADAEGDPVVGAPLTLRRIMPHGTRGEGHGAVGTVVVTDHGDGTYTAAPVNLNMSGRWDVTVQLEPPPTTEGATFSFCAE